MPVSEVAPAAPGVPVRRLNLRILHASGHDPARGTMVDLNRSTATGTIGGWTVHTQRRGADGSPTLCIRVDALDGRVLYISSNLSKSATNSKGPSGTFFGGHVDLMFKAVRTPEQKHLALSSFAAAFEKAWEIAGTPPETVQRRRTAQWDIQGAAALMSQEEVLDWRTTPSYARALHEGDVDMRSITRARDCGWTPATSLAFYDRAKRLKALSRPRLLSDRVFAEAGWTTDDLDDLAVHTGVDYRFKGMPTGWAQFTPDEAIAAARAGLRLRFVQAALGVGLTLGDAVLADAAGLTARELPRLVRSGRFDRDALASLAALRASQADLLAVTT